MDTLAQRVAKRAAQAETQEEASISRPGPMAVAPPGWEHTVKQMKKHPGEIDNPWALAWHMKNKGDTPGGKEAAYKLPPELFTKALNTGRAAFEADKKRVPVHDPAVHALLKENSSLPTGAASALLDAWLKGWDKANMDSPVHTAGMPQEFDQAQQEGMQPESEIPESRFPEKENELHALAVKMAMSMSRKALDFHSAPAAEKKFTVLLIKDLEPFIKDLPEHEQSRAKEVQVHAYQGFRHVVTLDDGDEVEHALRPVLDKLTELERMLQGQRMLFAAGKTAGESPQVTHIFKELFHICDELPSIVNQDVLLQLGVKPGPKRPSPGAPAKPRTKVKFTYKQAQDAILNGLKAGGWTVVAHLKIPHATSPKGTFRYWFKPQAIYYSTGANVKNFGEARSMWTEDYRNKDTGEMVAELEKHAHG